MALCPKQLAKIYADLKPLTPLDLSKTRTIAELVDAMARCSFGAGMLGEVVQAIYQETNSADKPIVIYYGDDKGINELLSKWQTAYLVVRFVGRDLTRIPLGKTVILVGDFVRDAMETKVLWERAGRVICINEHGMCKPGNLRDGHNHDVVLSDPRFVLRVTDAYISEKRGHGGWRVSDFVKSLSGVPGLSGLIASGTTVLRNMLADPDCTIFFTLSGVMTVAQMGLLIDDLINTNRISLVVSTGALMAHGLVEGLGKPHYRYDPAISDATLLDADLNRVSTALEPEEYFDLVDEVVRKALANLKQGKPVGSWEIHREIGRVLAKLHPDHRAIFRSAYARAVPIIVPALIDSELGNDIYVENLRQKRAKKGHIYIDQERDTNVICNLTRDAVHTGIFTIGGGVPRNWTQNVMPLLDLMGRRLDLRIPPKRFRYGVRIDPTSVGYGNLSGCTYKEGGSWGKMDLDRGQFAELPSDATIVWPFIQRAALTEMYGA